MNESGEQKNYHVLAITDQGYQGIKMQAQERVVQHRADIKRLEDLRTWLLEDGPDGSGPTPLVAELTHHLQTMFDSKVSELEESITVLEGTIAELERCGY